MGTITRHLQFLPRRLFPLSQYAPPALNFLYLTAHLPSKAKDARSPEGAAAENRRHEAFESGNPRDAYSSVSHLKGNLDSLSFAIGLREEGGQEGALERLLPMLKIQPRPTGEVLEEGGGILKMEYPTSQSIASCEVYSSEAQTEALWEYQRCRGKSWID